MFTKRRISLFFSMILTSISLLAGQIVTSEKLEAIVKLFALPFISGRLTLTEVVMFLIISIGIESYIAHRMIKKPYVFILPRMMAAHLVVTFFENLFFAVLFIIAFSADYLDRAMNLFVANAISVTLVVFIVRFCYFVIALTAVFSWYAPSVDRRQLRKAMLYATTLNYLIVLAVLLFTEHSYLRIYAKFN